MREGDKNTITGLSLSRWGTDAYDFILLIVNHLTKMAQYIPVTSVLHICRKNIPRRSLCTSSAQTNIWPAQEAYQNQACASTPLKQTEGFRNCLREHSDKDSTSLTVLSSGCRSLHQMMALWTLPLNLQLLTMRWKKGWMMVQRWHKWVEEGIWECESDIVRHKDGHKWMLRKKWEEEREEERKKRK